MGPRFMSSLAVVAILVATGACIDSQLVPCGGQLCPSGTRCVAGELCATGDQIAACDGLADGTTCTVGGGVGRCDRGVCVAAGCGNGKIDPGEVCDDVLGIDPAAGERCSADCTRIEVCGNGVVDPSDQCDDGNTNPADGCDACVLTAWRATAVIGGNANATTVALARPSGVAVDRNGNLYIADTLNQRIRRVDATTGVLTTVAGTGTLGYSGDGGAATSAQLESPRGVAVDGLGTLYIAEAGRIRQVDSTGVITTVAGTGSRGYGGDGGAATSAQLYFPNSVAVDGLGTLYIADTNNHRIRRVDATTGVITTVAGTGSQGPTGDGGAATAAELAYPSGVVVDGFGTLFIADAWNHRIRRVDSTTGIITRVAGTGTPGTGGDGGAATSAQLDYPSAVALDHLGTLYITDTSNHRIRRVDATTGIVTTVAGTGLEGYGGDGAAATNAQLDAPQGVVVDNLGTLYVADTLNHRIRRIDTTGVITTAAGAGVRASGDGGAATSAELNFPYGGVFDGLGNFYVADSSNQRIRRVDAAGVITTVAGTGTQCAIPTNPCGDGGAATSAQLGYPLSVAIDSVGNLYIADTVNQCIRRVDVAGVITTVAGDRTSGYGGDGGPATSAQLALPSGVAVDHLGTLYIADTYNNRIRRVDATTGVITTIAGNGIEGYGGDGGPGASAELDHPYTVSVDSLGTVFLTDTNNHRIRRVDATTGIITTVAGTGTAGSVGNGGPATSAQLAYPQCVAVVGTNLYIADTNNNRIQRVDATGVITTVAGADFGSSGDGVAATSAYLTYPAGVTVDSVGNVFIADTVSHRIRRVDGTTGVITTMAGAVDPEGMGPLAQAHFADPRALVVTAPFTLVAGGSSGTVQALTGSWLEVVAGRYAQQTSTSVLARFRNSNFGTVTGVEYDAAAGAIYLTESSSNRVHVVTIVDPGDENTWTIAPLANAAGTSGFADGAAQVARFRDPTGLFFDTTARQLYVADTGNHVIRAIDLSVGIASATVRTVAGIPATRGFFGDGGAASTALLYAPQAITRCGNGDLFIADTGNHRVRRVAAGTNVITTVLGVGVAASSGDGRPASTFPVNAPLGLACDAIGNVFVTSTTTVRLVPADASGSVDGTGEVQTIYGAPPRDTFPASVTTCLTGLAVPDATSVQVVDSCTGLLVELRRAPK